MEQKNLGLLYSTDLSLDALDIVRMYKLRFQQEFIFRDGKQHFGLGDCQMRKRVAKHVCECWGRGEAPQSKSALKMAPPGAVQGTCPTPQHLLFDSWTTSDAARG